MKKQISKEVIISKLGKKIKELREAKKLRFTKFSNRLDISDAHLAYIENGKRTPSLPLFVDICLLLGCTPNDLLSGK